MPADEYRGVPHSRRAEGVGRGGLCPACSACPDLPDSPGEDRICFSWLWREMMLGHLARRMCRLDGRFSDPVIPGSPLQYGKALYQHMCDPPHSSLLWARSAAINLKKYCRAVKTIRLSSVFMSLTNAQKGRINSMPARIKWLIMLNASWPETISSRGDRKTWDLSVLMLYWRNWLNIIFFFKTLCFNKWFSMVCFHST